MYDVREYMDNRYKIYELIDGNTNSLVKVAPEIFGTGYMC